MINKQDKHVIRLIAERASKIYLREIGRNIGWQYIAIEIECVHDEIGKMRLQEWLNADDGNFMHDVGGIHRHLDIVGGRMRDGFWPRFMEPR